MSQAEIEAKRKAMGVKRMHVLRTREDDKSDWSQPEYYPTKRERDGEASLCRILGGIRTHSYQESSAEAIARAVREQEESR